MFSVRCVSRSPGVSLGPVKQDGEVNVLLVGSSDPRHILKTIAGLKDTDSLNVSLRQFNSFRDTPGPSMSDVLLVSIQIWVIENSMEVMARQLLLLTLSLAPEENTSVNSG